ncbi:hypothetical protein LJC22_02080 [Desulfosarcina sp. OttesenSCG-928-G10]|nr:hypothetical protein [Desulfosarcina sp. OttesenSCG-928-G10]
MIRATIDQPSFPAMEAIGGTGDTLTGLLGVLCLAGFSRVEAAIHAAKVNRLCAAMVCPTRHICC